MRIDAIHVSNCHKTMTGFATIEEAIDAVNRWPGGYIVDIHDDGSILWSDFPQRASVEFTNEHSIQSR